MYEIPSYAEQRVFIRDLSRGLPPEMREMVLQRDAMGRELYGDEWAKRDNLAEALPEIADAWLYVARAILRGDMTEERACMTLVSVAVAWIFIDELRARQWEHKT